MLHTHESFNTFPFIILPSVGLAASLGINTAVEMTKKTLGLGETVPDNPLLTQANIEKIVSTLCRVRGAALKIGQMISIQGYYLVVGAFCEFFLPVRFFTIIETED